MRDRRKRVAPIALAVLGAILLASAALAMARAGGAGTTTAYAAEKNSQRDKHPLYGVASIVEADVVNASYSYSKELGPRIEYSLANINVHAGEKPDSLTFSQLGGPLPDGRFVEVSELPQITPGSRYIFLLGAKDWFHTPLWTFEDFRVEKIGKKSFVVGPGGTPVLSVKHTGLQYGKKVVVDKRKPIKTPISHRPAETNISESDDEIAKAMSPNDFAAAVARITADLGGHLGKPATFTPTAKDDWSIQETVKEQ